MSNLITLEHLPSYVSIVFLLTTLVTLVLFLRALISSDARQYMGIIGLGISLWLFLQYWLSHSLFYINTVGDTPPWFPFIGFIPPFILMAILFNTKRGKAVIDSLPLDQLTFLSIVRVPVEIVLFWLFIYGTIPELMTFEGRNFDILAGITAPFIAYFGYKKGALPRKFLLWWNIICLALLVNIISHAILSFPTVAQQLAFDQPNVGILYFPFFWLPSCIVPIVFFTHLVSIRRLRSATA